MVVKIQFEPFTSVVSVGFWAGLSKRKLEAGMIKDMQVWGYYEKINRGGPLKFYLDERSFEHSNSGMDEVNDEWKVGSVLFVETEAAIKSVDLRTIAVPSLAYFVMIVYVDLKRHAFMYLFGFPVVAPEGSVYAESISVDTERTDYIYDACMRPISDTMVVLGWPARHRLGAESLSLLSVRRESHTFTLRLSEYKLSSTRLPGWEFNQPKTIDLSPLMDPRVLAESAANLNLKLIKWQLAPHLDLDQIQRQRCLLFGAGTLGCNVLRLLIGWGVKEVTVVDSGICTHSNPTRQSMISLADAVKKTPKVDALAEQTRLIAPHVHVEPIQMRIPMPGHMHSDSLLADCRQIDHLISTCDVVFLLTDSRESRWLPTVLAKRHSKLCICIAIGFDSYLAMRHGPSCYFCQDSCLPLTDTVSNRTMDMQCTVSRPGVSMVAAGLGVELMVSVLSGDQGGPQQVRGSLFGHHQTMIGPGSEFCQACSQTIQSTIDSVGFDQFFTSALTDPTYLQQLSRPPLNDRLPVDEEHLSMLLEPIEF